MIRPYSTSDLPRLREICRLTGDAGGDATGLWSSDELLAQLYLDPYLAFAPDWAWVVDVGEPDAPDVLGYLVAVPDTTAFISWWRESWTPRFAEHHPRPTAPFTAEDELVLRGYDPGVPDVIEIRDFPAHLHVDLLPEAQGQGWGRALIERLRDELIRVGAVGVHLVMDPGNARARAFYDRVGFTEIRSGTMEGTVFGMRIPPAAS